MITDKAGKAYWDEVWTDTDLRVPVDPTKTHITNYVNLQFHEYFSKIFASTDSQGKVLLEVGCARSAWLPYFSKQFGFQIQGLDYSEIGCEQSRKILRDANIEGVIVCADFFSPPDSLLERFDVVITFGVVEHFADTRSCIAALSRFLRPGGLLITNIPNMVGMIGTIERFINRPVYDIHVPLDRQLLHEAHSGAGLEVVECNYFMSTNFGVLNLNGLDPRAFSWKLKRVLIKGLQLASALVWVFERFFISLPSTRLWSPYIHCLARKR